MAYKQLFTSACPRKDKILIITKISVMPNEGVSKTMMILTNV